MVEKQDDEKDVIVYKDELEKIKSKLGNQFQKKDFVLLAEKLNIDVNGNKLDIIDTIYRSLNVKYEEFLRLINQLVTKDVDKKKIVKYSDMITFRVEKGGKEKLESLAKEANLSLSEFVKKKVSGESISIVEKKQEQEKKINNEDGKFLLNSIRFFYELFKKNASSLKITQEEKDNLKKLLTRVQEVAKNV